MFWQHNMLSTNFQSLRKHPAIEQAKNSSLPGAVHQLCIDGIGGDELIRHITLDPGCVTSRDCYGFTPLHWAAHYRNVNAVGHLLLSGADVNAVCKRGRSALSWTGSWAICKMLLDAGADIGMKDYDGNDAIICALNAHAGMVMIDLLLETSSKLGHQFLDKDGSTYLMVAVLEAPVEICRMVMEYTADISAQDQYGFSALSYAIRHQCHETMELLLDHGADTTQLDEDGDSIISLVAFFGDIETMRILEAEQIEGLPMEAEDVKVYWNNFYQYRDYYFLGWRAPIEEEEAAFQAFLDSITPCEPRKTSPNPTVPHVPGAFSLSDDGSDIEDDVDSDNESDVETSDYESCDEEFMRFESEENDVENPRSDIGWAVKQIGGNQEYQGGSIDNCDKWKT